MDDKILQQLTASQTKAVLHTEGPLLILAGPGSGKTRVITYRISALIDSGVRPYNICAITFTNKAAEEMRQRAFCLGASAGAHISTFHSLCVRILRKYCEAAGVKPNFSIYDTSEQSSCCKQAVKDCDLETSNFSPARMLAAISTLKNNLEDVESFQGAADDFFTKTLARIYKRYQQILAEHNSLDFDDLLMKTAALLKNNQNVCDELADRYKYLLIDEYQDTNQAQYQIAKAIASPHRNICVTGDPDQSVYRWRGADIRNILAFETDWPEAVVVKLEENFRSSPNILSVADHLIAYNKKRKEKKLIATKPPGSDIVINVYGDEYQEAQGIADRVKELANEGVSLSQIAVFYRVNAASRVLEEAFVKNQTPYQIVRGVEFYSRKEIRDLLAYLKILVNPDDETALLRIINTPARGIGKTTLNKIKAYAAQNRLAFGQALKKVELIESISKNPKAKIAEFVNMIERFKTDSAGPVAPLAERVFIESDLKKSLQSISNTGTNDQLENVNELINSAAKYDKSTDQPSLLDYLQQISLFSDTDTYEASSDRVALMTLHAAKGLEFENVFIVGVEDGLLPHERGQGNEDELEEERRLFFVGITRAKTGLYISCAQYRTIHGQLLRTIPSPFLYELGISLTEPACEEQSYDTSDDIDQGDQYVPQFTGGQLVRHKKFGLGRVTNFTDTGQNSTVVIKFNTGQTKTLMVKYANLETIDI